MNGLAALVAFSVTFVVTPIAARVARSRGWLDQPNERSSHWRPIPRVGGMAIMAGVAVGVLLGPWPIAWPVATLLLCALGIGVLGVIDDLRPLGPLLRLAIQLVVAFVFVAAVHPEATLLPGRDGPPLDSTFTAAFVVVWLLAVTNAWNFMDGIDGLLAGLTAIAAVAMYALLGSSQMLLPVFGASLGFLVWNWHPARVFMGDGGSLFLGFTIAAMPFVATARAGGEPVSCSPPTQPALVVGLFWIVLALTPVLVDTGLTLLGRLLRREDALAGHRDHLYQRLVDHGTSQRVVAAGYCAAGVACLIGIAAFGPPEIRSLVTCTTLPLPR